MEKYVEDDYLMLSGIQHFSFCRRQWGLIHIGQIWQDNYLTYRGEKDHDIAHDMDKKEKRGDTIISRGMQVKSEKLGISGACDVVEFHRFVTGTSIFGYDGLYRIVPIEYKSGSDKDLAADRFQLTAEAICLEEMFCTSIDKGYLYYRKNNRRYEVVFDEEIRRQAAEMFAEMHGYMKHGYIPKGRKNKSCKSCSLIDECGIERRNPSPEKYLKDHFQEFYDEKTS